MAVATIFESGADEKKERQSWLRNVLTGGFGAADDMPRVTAPPRPPADTPKVARGQREAPEETTAQKRPLGRSAYLRGLEEVIRRTEREEVEQTLVSVSPAEVQKLVRKAAKAKARYLAAALDMAEGDTLPDSASVRALDAARERHEALEAGLQNLIAEMRRGNVDIQGVDEDAAQPAADV